MSSGQKELSINDSDARKFNHNMIQLFDQLSKVYPDDADLFTYRDKLALLSKANFKVPSEGFLTYAQNYVDEIMSCNDTFFIDFDPKSQTSNPTYQELIGKIIRLWLDSQDSVKTTIWKYMQVLLILSVKTHKRVDLVVQINKHRQTPIKI